MHLQFDYANIRGQWIGNRMLDIRLQVGLHPGEGNGTPLQCSCLENPRDGGAWGAAICGVTQSQT